MLLLINCWYTFTFWYSNHVPPHIFLCLLHPIVSGAADIPRPSGITMLTPNTWSYMLCTLAIFRKKKTVSSNMFYIINLILLLHIFILFAHDRWNVCHWNTFFHHFWQSHLFAGEPFFNEKENGFIVIFLNLFLLTYTSLECNLQFAHIDALFYVFSNEKILICDYINNVAHSRSEFSSVWSCSCLRPKCH